MLDRNPAYDPILPLGEAAEYLGFRGKHRTRSLARLNLERMPMPGVGSTRFGIRLSVLNAYLARIGNPKSRTPALRDGPLVDLTHRARSHGRFAVAEQDAGA